MSSLEGLPGVTENFRRVVQAIRGYLRDFPELNRLVAGEESTDRQIAWALVDAVNDFNGTPHVTTLSLDDLIASQQTYLIIRMAVVSLLESVGLLQTRNHINYSTGGINVGVNDKTPLIQTWLRYFKAWTDQRKQQVKVAMNIEGMLGSGSTGVFSEYWVTNGSYASY